MKKLVVRTKVERFSECSSKIKNYRALIVIKNIYFFFYTFLQYDLFFLYYSIFLILFLVNK